MGRVPPLNKKSYSSSALMVILWGLFRRSEVSYKERGLFSASRLGGKYYNVFIVLSQVVIKRPTRADHGARVPKIIPFWLIGPLEGVWGALVIHSFIRSLFPPKGRGW